MCILHTQYQIMKIINGFLTAHPYLFSGSTFLMYFSSVMISIFMMWIWWNSSSYVPISWQPWQDYLFISLLQPKLLVNYQYHKSSSVKCNDGDEYCPMVAWLSLIKQSGNSLLRRCPFSSKSAAPMRQIIHMLLLPVYISNWSQRPAAPSVHRAPLIFSFLRNSDNSFHARERGMLWSFA